MPETATLLASVFKVLENFCIFDLLLGQTLGSVGWDVRWRGFCASRHASLGREVFPLHSKRCRDDRNEICDQRECKQRRRVRKTRNPGPDTREQHEDILRWCAHLRNTVGLGTSG